jgi:hypothetical protein
MTEAQKQRLERQLWNIARVARKDVLDTEAQLRSKKELIERFITDHFATLPASADVGAEFDSYWEAQKQSAG